MTLQSQAIHVMMALMSDDPRGQEFIEALAGRCFGGDTDRALAYTQALAAGVA